MAQSVAQVTSVKISYEEFLERFMDGEHLEWVDGEAIAMSPVSDEHSLLVVFLLRVMGEYIENLELGTLRSEPFQMKTGSKLPGRSPDILFLATENLSRLKKTYLQGPADLVVEVISPESRKRDRMDKFSEYEQGGVREYWLIDPVVREVEFYVRNASGTYQRVLASDTGIYHSSVIKDFWMDVNWLWQRPLPKLMDLRRVWGFI